MQLGFGRVFFSFSTIFSYLYSESQCSADDQTRAAYVFKLANDGHDTHAIQAYLGHRSIMSTVQGTARGTSLMPITT
jgi:hypothetical protein